MFYRLPLKERFTRITSGASALICAGKYIKVDNIGIFVEFDKEDLVTPEMIRRCGTPIRETYCIVEANTLNEAIEKFYQNYEAANWENPAVWIDEKSVIIKYPYCEFLSRTKTGRFICGPKIPRENCGTRGMCVLEWGIDPPLTGNCPIYEMCIGECKPEEVIINEKKYLLMLTRDNDFF